MAPEVKAAVEGVIISGSFVILGLMVAAIVMMRDVAKSARCRWCEHCRRAVDDEKVVRTRKRHESYHFLTDRAPSACQNDDCPGRK